MAGCVALIVAAGRGSRAGGGPPKQYRFVAGEPVLRRAVCAFLEHPRIEGVNVVIHPDDRGLYDRAVGGLDLFSPVAGGNSRQESVRRGLESLVPLAPDCVLIHDAARPFVTAAVIDRVIAALARVPGAIAGLPVVDTLKRVADAATPGTGPSEREAAAIIVGTVDRKQLWRAQTPQGFHFQSILAAHRQLAGTDLTDDAAVAERCGLTVAMVPGDEHNIKLTTEEDLQQAERRAGAAEEVRTGMGFDVHRFARGDQIMLCGVAVPHTAGLEGHSDADVGLHALTDALLGAIGAGDIGQHFPPSDERWRGATSHLFLDHAAGLVRNAGGSIVNVDVTIVCERPRVGPHRRQMVECIAGILAISPLRVSVKATTTEGLGFTGRSEGIAAQAIASVRLPTGGQTQSPPTS